jgi:hypothetical protein
LGSGVLCFFLKQERFIALSQTEEIVVFIFVSVSLCFVLVFSFIECFNFGLCGKCCGTDFQYMPLLHSRCQLILILFGTLSAGVMFGLLFGFTDFENSNRNFNKPGLHLVYILSIGAILGGILGRLFFSYVSRSFSITF